MSRLISVTETGSKGRTYPGGGVAKWLGRDLITSLVASGTGSLVFTEGRKEDTERVVDEAPATLQAAINLAPVTDVQQITFDVVNIVGHNEPNFTTRPQTFLIGKIVEISADANPARTVMVYREPNTQQDTQYILNDTLANVAAAANA